MALTQLSLSQTLGSFHVLDSSTGKYRPANFNRRPHANPDLGRLPRLLTAEPHFKLGKWKILIEVRDVTELVNAVNPLVIQLLWHQQQARAHS